MADDLNRNIAKVRVLNAERRLLCTPSSDHYAKQAAQAAYEEALVHLEKLGSRNRG